MNNIKKSFCVIPWVQLASKPIGTARVCCLMANSQDPQKGTIRDENKRPYNLGRDDFDKIKNGKKIRDIRLQMLAGVRPDDCTTCWVKEDMGATSRRTVSNDMYLGEFEYADAVTHTRPDGSTDYEPSYWDLRFGNLCNLKCVMCHPASSSQWYEDYVLISGTTKYKDSGVPVELVQQDNKYREPQGLYNWWDNTEFWTKLEAKIPYLKQVYMVGGEPMLIEPHYDFLQKVIDSGRAQEVTLEYDTNLTAIHSRALELWKHFKQILLRVSLDDSYDQYNYVRFPGKWTMVSKNVERLSQLDSNIKLDFTVTWQVTTAFTTPNLLRYLNKYENSNTTIRILSGPDYFDVAILSKQAKHALIKIYQDLEKELPRMQVSHLIKYLQTNLDGRPDKVKECVSVLDKLDSARGTDWQSTFPQLQQYLL
jgi:sulfatase maturation enzyme AslB (radical SAM superfamily)